MHAGLFFSRNFFFEPQFFNAAFGRGFKIFGGSGVFLLLQRNGQRFLQILKINQAGIIEIDAEAASSITSMALSGKKRWWI